MPVTNCMVLSVFRIVIIAIMLGAGSHLELGRDR